MSDNLPFYFTATNNNLSLDTFSDPLGMQVIWSHYGLQIFKGVITSRTSNLLHYTIVLFHHYIIRELYGTTFFTEIRKKYNDIYGSDLDLITSLIIFFENLLIITTSPASKKGHFPVLPGMSKYRQSPERYNLQVDKEGGILSRQLYLGLNGRYKTPLVEIGFLTSSYNYSYDPELWQQVETIFSSWREINDLKTILIEILRQGLLKDFDFNKLQDRNNNELLKLYTTCFADKRYLKRVRDFWKEKLLLNEGAASSIFSIIENDGFSRLNDIKKILTKATEELNGQEQEKIKCRDILAVEPFLSRLDLIFKLCTSTRAKIIQDIREDVDNILQYCAIPNVSTKDSRGNLQGLINCYSHYRDKRNIEAFINALYQYHCGIMEYRKGDPWFSLNDGKFINRLYYYNHLYDPADIKDPPWIHGFYIDAVANIFKEDQQDYEVV